MPYLGLAAVALALAAPLALGAQQSPVSPAAADSGCVTGVTGSTAGVADTAAIRRCNTRPALLPGPALRPRLATDRLVLSRPAPLSTLGSMRVDRPEAVRVANQAADSLRHEAIRRAEESFRMGANERLGWAPLTPPGTPADATAVQAPPVLPVAPPSATSAAADKAMEIFGDYADLGLVLNSRLETKLERSRNERCTSYELLNPAFNCSGSFQPQFDFQFNVRTGGVVADRIHVNVDYDSQREFDASNNINVYYEGKSDELIERLEVGNVSFTPTASRFITGGIPSGNYGLQAKGQLGPMRFSTIVAQQKGNRVNGRAFQVGGDGTLQSVTTDLEDFRFEQRRFFWVVDPKLFGDLFPNIDILNATQLRTARDRLPIALRPRQVRLYRWRADAPTFNAQAPKFRLLEAPATVPKDAGVPYELMTPGQDYYIDPSQLWFVLVRPVSSNERIVLAYTPESGEPDPAVTGTPDLALVPGKDQTAILVYSSEARTTDPVFRKEIRSVYRIGGEDLRRETVTLRVGTQAGGGQEVPTGGGAQTFLQMLGLAQSSNSGVFDVENRLWPRPGDPVQAVNGGGRSLFTDRFLVMPSTRPFAARDSGGRIDPPNVANDTIYAIEPTVLNSVQRPAARYFLRATFQAQGGGEVGSLMLGSVQVSRNSERLTIDGISLQRGTDYEVDYDLGRVTFLRPDTLFRSRRQVMVQYEENPLFAAAPTNVFGIASQLPFQNGQLNFIAISQNQRTAFNRPPLGFEPASSLVAGISGDFRFDASPLSRFLERIPTVGAVGASNIIVGGEIATSRPQPNSAGVAYVESFEGEGGVPLSLSEGAWYYGSRPSAFEKSELRDKYSGSQPALDTALAATLAWQNTGGSTSSVNQESSSFVTFTLPEIDPQVKLVGQARPTPEQVLWMSLYPANVGGFFTGRDYLWRFADQPSGRRWRSIRTVISPTGADLSRTEYLEFWALVDPSSTGSTGKNPVIIADLGDISENSLAFVPESVTVTSADSNDVFGREFRGRQPSGLGRLDTERDSLTNQFDTQRNDVGLPSDVADRITVTPFGGGATREATRYPVCRANINEGFFIGDSRANCTVGNSRLEEEDINLDRSPNDRTIESADEQVFRYVIDLNDRSYWARLGRTYEGTRDKADGLTHERVGYQWALIRVPIKDTSERIGQPELRRIRALRLTMISGGGTQSDEFTQTAIARLRFVGSPWLKRAERIVRTLVGSEEAAGGYQIAGIIGTQDAADTLPYTPPPGVIDAPETRQGDISTSSIQINERSIRILAGGASGAFGEGDGIPLNHRAEAYFRFPEGQKNFMGYRQLQVWARGRGEGWTRSPSDTGELQFFVKVGRDPRNFYLFRRDVREGPTRDAWTDVAMKFDRLYRLRSSVQNYFIRGRSSAQLTENETGCTAADRALLGVADPGAQLTRTAYWACLRADSGTYMLFTESPNTSAPNLAQVQELAVGILRADVRQNSPINSDDVLEVWADDIRLTGVVDDPGYAGELSLSVNAGDVGRFAVSASRRDANFRQLGEAPSYLTDNSFAFSTSFQLDRFVPGMQGWSVPLTYTTGRAGQDPYFIAQQDVLGAELQGLRTPRSTSSRYGVSLRRSTPTRLPYVGPIIDNLIVDAALNTSNGRDNYNTRGTHQYDVNANYSVQAQARSWAMPGFITGAVDHLPGFLRGIDAVRSLRQARFRWNPSAVRFSSGLSRSNSRTTNYLKPAVIPYDSIFGSSDLDPGRLVTSLNHVWNNTAGIELRPFGALSAQWSFSSLRDLRHYERDIYNDSINVGAVAAAERDRAFGLDVGLERERRMTSAIAFQPVLTRWLRPRAELSSSFSYLRDPNSRQVVLDTLDGDGVRRLPRRLNNSQVFSTGVALDLGRALLGNNNSTARLALWRRVLADAIQPVDASYTRTYSSAFDGTPFTPGLGYQFGLGGLGDFLSQRDQQAASAGFNNAAQLRAGLSLPLGFSLQQEMRRSFDRTFYRVSDNRQLFRENTTLVLPRVSLGWNYRPTVALVTKVITNISANAGWEPSETRGFAPAFSGADSAAERSLTTMRAIPVRASVTWAFLGDLTTTATYREQKSTERRPGAYVLGDGNDVSVSFARGFKLPKQWNLSDQVMTSVAWQQQAMRRYLPDSTGGVAANQASNGRTSLSFNADTQIAENLLGSLVMSRVVNFDNVSNRRFNQFVLTAVFQLTFQAGELR